MNSLAVVQERKILSGFALKWIAVISMVIDHFGSIVMNGVIAPYQTNGMMQFTDNMPFMVYHSFQIKNVCEILGSIAFPIFCFLIVEGFLHTRNRLKYGIRMGIFALVSEIPYNLAHYHTVWGIKLQNVMFTLCIGIFTLLLIHFVENKFKNQTGKRIALTALIVVAGMGLAYLIRSEYVFLGILTISLLYLLRGNRNLQLLGFAPLLIVSPWILLAVVPIFLYSGQRGRGFKYFFYVFYPTHFLVFAGIAYLLAQRPV